MDITNKQIVELKTEAGEHNDIDMVNICQQALSGDPTARKECINVINEWLFKHHNQATETTQ